MLHSLEGSDKGKSQEGTIGLRVNGLQKYKDVLGTGYLEIPGYALGLGIPGDTWGYLEIPWDAWRYPGDTLGYQEVSSRYLGIPGGNLEIPWALGYPKIPGDTWGYPGDTLGYLENS